jgi:alanine racemase
MSLTSPSPHPAWVEINLAQFRRNLLTVKSKVKHQKICLPVKGNGYGHGLCQIAKAAQEAGIDCLGVAFLSEAVLLRLSGISLPILVFGAVHENQIKDLIEFGLEFSISSKYKAELVLKQCSLLKKQCRVHLEIDTGMQRTGVRPETAVELFEWMKQHDYFQIVGVYSHFATADFPDDPFAHQQIEAMKALQQKIGREDLTWHLANSGGTLYYPESHFDMVRPGIVCYGYLPNGKNDPTKELLPCFAVKARLSYFKVVDEGRGISYGHRYKTARRARIVTVPIGYADGYRRIFTNRAPVLIRGNRFQVSGAVCMDQFMVDIGDKEAYVGDEVTLIGVQGEEEITLWDLAQLSSSVCNEILCGFNDRVPRIYTHD